jgi:hypothetical protein
MQTRDYTPGFSGMQLDLKTGHFELNSAMLTAGSLPSDPQMVTITAGQWPDNELPCNAIERYKFIGEQVMKIPDEYRTSAEFLSDDFSFDRDGSDYRTTITYQRRETTEEVEARLNKANAFGSSIKLVGGVMTVIHDGVVRFQITGMPDVKVPGSFIVVDGVTYLNQAFVKESCIEGNASAQFTVKPHLLNGRLVMAGIGLPRCMCAGGYTGPLGFNR